MLPTHNHKALLSACYPTPKLLAGQTIPLPDSNSLSKLIFYATARPNKLAKLGKAIVERADKAIYRDKRNEVAVTLDVCRELVSDVRVGLVYWEREALEIVDHVMKNVNFSKDSEIVARAANLFASILILGSPLLLESTGELYKSCLARFVGLLTSRSINIRSKLASLQVLQSSASSETTYTDSLRREFFSVILSHVLLSLSQYPTHDLGSMSTQMVLPPQIASLSSSQALGKRSLQNRPLPRIVLLPNEGEPRISTSSRVTDASIPITNEVRVLRAQILTLKSFIHLSHGVHVSQLIEVVLQWLSSNLTVDSAFFEWLAKEIVRTISLPYKATVLRHFLDSLLPFPIKSQAHSALIQGKRGRSNSLCVRNDGSRMLILTMIIGILRGDTLIPAIGIVEATRTLVDCLTTSQSLDLKDEIKRAIISLGCHIYYTDQVSDILEVLIATILKTFAKSPDSPYLEILTETMFGLVEESEAQRGEEHDDHNFPIRPRHDRDQTIRELPKLTLSEGGESKRSQVKPSLLQPALVLLFAPKEKTRYEIQRLLLEFLRSELTLEYGTEQSDDREMESFFSACLACMFILLTGQGEIPKNLKLQRSGFVHSNGTSKRSSLSGRSLIASIMEKPDTISNSNGNGERTFEEDGNIAVSISKIQPTVVDYAFAKQFLTSLNAQKDHRIIFQCVPLILALDSATNEPNRSVLITEIIAVTLLSIGSTWEVPTLVEASKEIASFEHQIPRFPTEYGDHTELPVKLQLFETNSLVKSTVVEALAGCHSLREASNQDSATLVKNLTLEWTPQKAIYRATTASIPPIEIRAISPSPRPDSQDGSVLFQRQPDTPSVSDLKASLGSVILASSTCNASTINSTLNSNRSQSAFGAGSSIISPNASALWRGRTPSRKAADRQKLLKAIPVDGANSRNMGSQSSIFSPPYSEVHLQT